MGFEDNDQLETTHPQLLESETFLSVGKSEETSHPFTGDLDLQTPYTDLKTLEGACHVTVRAIPEDQDKEEILKPPVVSPDASSGVKAPDQELETSDRQAESGEDSAVNDEPKNDEDALSDTVNEQSVSVRPDIQSSPLPTLCFEVKALLLGSTSTTSEEVVVRRTMQDIVALQTSLSESLVRIPGGQLDKALATEGRSAGIGLNNRMETLFGLTPLDTVRATSKLLGGLIEVPIDNESVERQKGHIEYLCKCTRSCYAFC